MASGGLCPASRNRRHEVWGNKESLETRMPSCPTGRLGAEPLTRVGGQSPGLIYCPKHCGCLSLICAHIRILFFFFGEKSQQVQNGSPQPAGLGAQYTQASVITGRTLKGRVQTWRDRNSGLLAHSKIGREVLRKASPHPRSSAGKCPTVAQTIGASCLE